MFGLEKGKKKGEVADDVYELEVELQDAGRRKELATHVENQIQKLKKGLREGGNKETVDAMGVLLHGYAAFQNLIQRYAKK